MGLDESRPLVWRMIDRDNARCLREEKWWRIAGRPCLEQWFNDFKAWEDKETFKRAFDDDRMTIRGMGVAEKHRTAVHFELRNAAALRAISALGPEKGSEANLEQFGYKDPTDAQLAMGAVGYFEAPILNKKGEEIDARGKFGSNVALYYGIKGIRARTNPRNFLPDQRGLTQKIDLGLHDLSATVLKLGRPIFTQCKYYTDSVWVFMPLPQEEDLEAFYHLNLIAKEPGILPQYKQHVRMIASEFTRIKFAQETDMGCSYVALGPPDSLGRTKVRYGGNGLDENGQKPTTKEAADRMLARRRNLALSYKSILSATHQEGHNEIILAYRSHGNRLRRTRFPMFAVGDETGLHVVNPGPNAIIHNDGSWESQG